MKTGYLNLVALRCFVAVENYISINLTKMHVLDMFPTIRVAVAYFTSNGETIPTFPAGLSLLDKCTVGNVDFGLAELHQRSMDMVRSSITSAEVNRVYRNIG